MQSIEQRIWGRFICKLSHDIRVEHLYTPIQSVRSLERSKAARSMLNPCQVMVEHTPVGD